MDVPASFVVATKSGNIIADFSNKEKAIQFVDIRKERNGITTLRVMEKIVTFKEIEND